MTMTTSPTVSTIAFIGAMAMIGLVVFKVVSMKTGLLLGGGLMAVGYITQPTVSA